MISDEELRAKVVAWTQNRVGTFKVIWDLNEVRQDEWDALITDESTMTSPSINRSSAARRIPAAHLNVFRFIYPHDQTTSYMDEVSHPTDKEFRRTLIVRRRDIAGHQVARTTGLPEALQDLVSGSLLAAIEDRDYQYGFDVDESVDGAIPAFEVRPFLIGPDSIILAGSYVRPDHAS